MFFQLGNRQFYQLADVGSDNYRIRFVYVQSSDTSWILTESSPFSIVSGGPPPQNSVAVVNRISTSAIAGPTPTQTSVLPPRKQNES
jgi:hypothetical protein